MSESQSEVTTGGCLARILGFIAGMLLWLVVFQAVTDHYELRDLQRRVAELEQKK